MQVKTSASQVKSCQCHLSLGFVLLACRSLNKLCHLVLLIRERLNLLEHVAVLDTRLNELEQRAADHRRVRGLLFGEVGLAEVALELLADRRGELLRRVLENVSLDLQARQVSENKS